MNTNFLVVFNHQSACAVNVQCVEYSCHDDLKVVGSNPIRCNISEFGVEQCTIKTLNFELICV